MPATRPKLAAKSGAEAGAVSLSWGRRLLGCERRWADHTLAAFAPPSGPGLSPLAGEVDYAGALARMLREVTPWAALGLRLGLWIAALAPLWLWRRACTISSLATEARPELLRALLVHRVFAVRELVLLLKLCVAMALLGAPSVRVRSGYDHAQPAESGVQTRLRPDRGQRALTVVSVEAAGTRRSGSPRGAS